MEQIQHIVTAEDIAAVKKQLADDALKNGTPLRPVFKVGFMNNTIQFLYTWINKKEYDTIVGSKGYKEGIQKDPANTEKFFQRSVLSTCVLWPYEFNSAVPEALNPYPAGIFKGLLDAIMSFSGFSDEALPDEVIIEPEMAEVASQEEITALKAEHPLAAKFGAVLKKPFYIYEYDQETRIPRMINLRNYYYTCMDRATYQLAKATSDEDKGIDIVLNACVLWPNKINWDNEPANYRAWLFQSIMTASGFNLDPSGAPEQV